jgi:ketosteroid isomerase-like protein
MSQENVEIVRQAYEAFNRGDIGGAVANIAAPDFEYVSTGVIPGMEEVYRGPEGFRRFLEGFWAEFDDPQAEINEITEADDLVLVSLTLLGRGKQSGAEAGWSIFQLWTVRDGKAVGGQAFTSRHEALEAAGLRE